MKLLIKSLKLSNFKGIKEYRLMLNSTETKLYGANGTGKTTVADAFFFIFTGADSQGTQAKEWVQTLDENNEKVHKADHEAEVIIEVDGDTITLARRVAEKWVKPRGQKEEVLDEKLDYDYFIDGVSTPAKQFETFITDTVFGGKFTANEFVLLSNPTAFCNLPWKEQRDILYKVCGSATDEEVIATEERFNFLTEALKHKDVETLKKALRKSISDTKDEIKGIEAVIKDRKNSLIQEYDRQEVLLEKAAKEEHIKSLQDKLNADSNKLQELRDKQKAILEIEALRDKAKREYYEENTKETEAAKFRMAKLESQLSALATNKDTCIKRIETARQENIALENTKADFKKRWAENREMTLPDDATVCPYCGQEVVGDKLQEIINSFEIKKEEGKKTLLAEADRIKGQENTNLQIIKTNEEMLTKFDEEGVEIKKQIEACKEIVSLGADTKPFDESEFESEIEVLQKEIKAFKAEDNTEIKEQIDLANKDLQMIAIKLSKCDTYDKSVKDIAAKEKELKEKQHSLADLEVQLMNVEDFVTTKVKMLEEKVNSCFENVQFKLFKQNLKGNWEETCIALAKASNGSLVDVKSCIANTALRVQAGIEIINALQKHFDYYCPIFIDNRESVTEVPHVEGQLVSFVVSENDKELRVE